MTDTIDQTLAERGKRYGSFAMHAKVTCNIKRAMIDSPNWETLPDYMKESLDMLAHKLGRILNGDAYYVDSFRDCIGYLKLAQDILEKTEGATDARTHIVTMSKEGWM